MARPAIRSDTPAGSRAQGVLLAMCLIIIAGGATLPQRLAGMTNIVSYSFAETFYGVLTAGLLVFSCVGWILWNASRRDGRAYRLTGVELGLVLLMATGSIGIYIASDKRAAVNHMVFILAPVFMAVLLVQLLTSVAKIKILLYTIAALGVVNAYECADQFFSSNEVMVQEYSRNPEAMLAKVAIQPGSYEHMMFEHHLRSKDVRGFFSTSNSAGSFMLMAMFAAIALTTEGYSLLKNGRSTMGEMVGKLIVLAVIVAGLGLTQSRGAIGSAVIAAVLFGIWYGCRAWLGRHRKLVAACLVVAVVGAGAAIVSYGRTYDTLPGGKSMLVRWQYWTGSMRMYTEHPMGVGGGNFATWYPRYKTPAAPETVKDPHNFILSFLTQYGPLGLLGFLLALFGALRPTVFGRTPADMTPTPVGGGFNRVVWTMLPAIVIAMLILRPVILAYDLGAELAVAAFIISVLMILPLLFFAGTFFLLSTKNDVGVLSDTAQAALLCGILGAVIHNCIDFAIFEPGVLTVLWAVVAAVVSLDFAHGGRSVRQVLLPARQALPAWGLAAICMVAFVFFVLLPVSGSELLMEWAGKAMDEGDIDKARRMFAMASRVDRLNAEACYSDGRLHLYEFQSGYADPNSIAAAETSLMAAISRNPASYKYHAKLAEVYATAAQTSHDHQRTRWLEKAFAAASEAVARYPGDAAERIALADIADDLGRSDEAIDGYRMAVAIEDAYRKQFGRMYAGRELFSRLGENKYQYARSRIAELSKGTD